VSFFNDFNPRQRGRLLNVGWASAHADDLTSHGFQTAEGAEGAEELIRLASRRTQRNHQLSIILNQFKPSLPSNSKLNTQT